jgi:DNA mismatch repair protein MutH
MTSLPSLTQADSLSFLQLKRLKKAMNLSTPRGMKVKTGYIHIFFSH